MVGECAIFLFVIGNIETATYETFKEAPEGVFRYHVKFDLQVLKDFEPNPLELWVLLIIFLFPLVLIIETLNPQILFKTYFAPFS